MENQRPGSTESAQQPTPQPELTTNPAAIPAQQVDASKILVSDADAQALLTIQNLQSGSVQHKQAKLNLGLLITLALVVLMVVFASYMLSSLKSGKNTQSTTSSSSQSNAGSATDNTSNQINQDVHSCSNLSTAISQC
jgi:ATP-dependent Zn protease